MWKVHREHIAQSRKWYKKWFTPLTDRNSQTDKHANVAARCSSIENNSKVLEQIIICQRLVKLGNPFSFCSRCTNETF